jgi:hypothetical protein
MNIIRSRNTTKLKMNTLTKISSLAVTRSIPGSTDETNLQGKLDPASMQLVMRTSVTKYYSVTPNQAPIFLHAKTSSRIFYLLEMITVLDQQHQDFSLMILICSPHACSRA